ncbi:MAG: Synerg-CTERM sorting domain-containing protein [Synergistes sp.]|nr:Synerg-CTERM sorting domain-containing protein [Synergistes sp.]
MNKLSSATQIVGGKADVKVGDGFTLADYDGSNGWKLTKTDNNLPVPFTNFSEPLLSVIPLPLVGENPSLTVKYYGAPTGKNMYLSALLYDNCGNLINYAKVADTSANENGEATLQFKNALQRGTCGTVAFVYEQVNGDGDPDYFSNTSMTFRVLNMGDVTTKADGGETYLFTKTLKNSIISAKFYTQLPFSLGANATINEETVKNVTEKAGKTSMQIKLTYDGGAENKETARFEVILGDKLKDYDKTKRLAVFVPLAIEDAGESRELSLTKYDVYPAEYTETEDFGIVSFSLPEYAKYFESGKSLIVGIGELNGDAVFAGEADVDRNKLPESITGVTVIQREDVSIPKAEVIFEGASGVEIKKCLTTLEMTVQHDGGAKDEDTADFVIKLEKEITPDENSTLAALLPFKDISGYAAFRAKYDKNTKELTFSVPEYGKYFSMVDVKIVELNDGVKSAEGVKSAGENSSSSSSGCNVGLGALALFALAGLALRKKQ